MWTNRWVVPEEIKNQATVMGVEVLYATVWFTINALRRFR